MTKYNNDIPGNAVGSAALVQKEMLKFANNVYTVNWSIEEGGLADMGIIAVRFRAPSKSSQDWLGVVTACPDGTKIVAFHMAPMLKECIDGLFSRLLNGSLKWKEDQYE